MRILFLYILYAACCDAVIGISLTSTREMSFIRLPNFGVSDICYRRYLLSNKNGKFLFDIVVSSQPACRVSILQKPSLKGVTVHDRSGVQCDLPKDKEVCFISIAQFNFILVLQLKKLASTEIRSRKISGC